MAGSNCVASSHSIVRSLQNPPPPPPTISSTSTIIAIKNNARCSSCKFLSIGHLCCSTKRSPGLINVSTSSSTQQPEEEHRHFYNSGESLLFKEDQETEFLEFDRVKKLNHEIRGGGGGGGSGGGIELKSVELEDNDEQQQKRRGGLRRGSELMKRSNVVAKQVICIHSALSFGFVSQLWVDTTSWLVSVIEVRPSLLSGELERFLLEDVSQVGDVVLIQDECVMKNEFKMIGMETLVGYDVVTPVGQNIGKVRGYTFNINSGAIDSLELDSFGISIIPSSLISTYVLFVEDVIEVVADTVVVHEAAASHIQRVTKGFWGAQKLGYSMDMDNVEGYPEVEKQPHQSEYGKGRRKRSPTKKSRTKERDDAEDWELPMDYL